MIPQAGYTKVTNWKMPNLDILMAIDTFAQFLYFCYFVLNIPKHRNLWKSNQNTSANQILQLQKQQKWNEDV